MEKTNIVRNDDIVSNCAKKFKVCGHPIRLRMLCIIKNGSVSVNDLCDSLAQPQPVISQHLAVLKECSIVNSKVNRNKRIYAISDQFAKDLINLIPEKYGRLSKIKE
jgi:DNA-binding transcriptional ArsR family regulator